MTIRPFSFDGDLELCREAEQEAYCDANSTQTVSEAILTDLVARIRRKLKQGIYWGFTAIDNNHPVGVVFVDRIEPQKLYIDNLYVRPAYRQQGIGRCLLQRVDALADELRCPSIELTVTAQNHSAVQLYESLGYSTTRYRMRRLVS